MTEEDAAEESERTRMRDVAHTPPHGEGANGVWTRGAGDVRVRDDAQSGDTPPVRGPSDDE